MGYPVGMASHGPARGVADRGDALVMFGLTGDLGAKKLFPALYDLAAAGRLGIPVIGVGRSEYSDADLRSMFDESLADHTPAGGGDVDRDVAASIDLSYLSGDSTESSTYDSLAEQLGDARSPVVYAALPPGIFGDVARGIASSGLADTTRLVTEKPFGEDAASARDLYDEIVDALEPERLFIVDHFLAKAAIENMLTVRTSNALIANSMCARFVESIDLVMSETGGVDGRGSFYESVGAINDVVQSHMLQMLALLTMEPPADDSDVAYHASRSELLGAIEPFDPALTVLGQYAGYRDLDDVDDDSQVETYVATVTSIDNDRWRDVPVTMRTGKQLGADATIATVTLRDEERRTGDGDDERAADRSRVTNRVRFNVKPSPSLSFDIGVLDPETHLAASTTVFACGPDDHGALSDYAVMLDNALAGQSRHFAQIDDVIAAWSVVAPIKSADLGLQTYEPGSDGPA